MRKNHTAHINSVIQSIWSDPPTQTVSDWASEHLRFAEPNNHGPFSLNGREYIREPLDAFADIHVSDQVMIFGAQTGKTGVIMGGAAWMIRNRPTRIFWVMPTRDTVRSFSKTRWMPLLANSPSIASMIPSGADRFDFSSLQQKLGASIVDMVWSNSPSALASVPTRVVILDEIDKFSHGTAKEADAVSLAEQRTKSFACPKKIKSSTPTIVDAISWQQFLKTDQRRRFVPCPSCGKHVIFAWSKQFTVLPLQGCEAFIRWDKEARRPDGTWDFDRVERSAHAECPHCGHHIADNDKQRMDSIGEWRPTAIAAEGFRGWHLPSLYASSKTCSFGRLAVKFLQQKRSLLGLQDFINGELAEPYQSQDTLQERVELITSAIPADAERVKIMTVDCQAKAPHFWFVVRAWGKDATECLNAGSCDTWEELSDIQAGESIDDAMVMVDSGFGAKSDAEVYRTCAQHGEFRQRNAKRPIHLGWLPAKGMPGRKRWKDDAGVWQPYYIRTVDPFLGTVEAGKCEMTLFEFGGDTFKDMLDAMRQSRGQVKWSVLQSASTDEYWRHMDSEVKTRVVNKSKGTTTWQWQMRSQHWPNHIKDCEVMQIAFAVFLNLLKAE